VTRFRSWLPALVLTALACSTPLEAKQKRVIVGRYYAAPIASYLAEASRDVYFTEAVVYNWRAAIDCAGYAGEYHRNAAAIRYKNRSEKAQATHDYLYNRYYQAYYSHLSAYYWYAGLSEEPFGTLATYSTIRRFYESSMNAYYYGLADFNAG
jgi:hypothetical protein